MCSTEVPGIFDIKWMMYLPLNLRKELDYGTHQYDVWTPKTTSCIWIRNWCFWCQPLSLIYDSLQRSSGK